MGERHAHHTKEVSFPSLSSSTSPARQRRLAEASPHQDMAESPGTSHLSLSPSVWDLEKNLPVALLLNVLECSGPDTHQRF